MVTRVRLKQHILANLILMGIVLAIRIPSLQAIGLLNAASIAGLAGHHVNETQLLSKALEIAPNNGRIRWRLSLRLAENGDNAVAEAVLAPLMRQGLLSPSAVQILLTDLIDIGSLDSALSVYKLVDDTVAPVSLTSHVASAIAYGFLQEGQTEYYGLEHADVLLAQALEIRLTSGFELLSQRLKSKGFWSSVIGQRLKLTLEWRSQSDPMESALVVVVPERELVADMLNIAPSFVTFGTELAENGSFEQRRAFDPIDLPPGWTPGFMTHNPPFNEAVFALGTDKKQRFSGNYVARVDGILLERVPDLAPARAGLWHEPINVQTGQPYLITFVYRTERISSHDVSLWLSPLPDFFGAQYFPATFGKWRRITIIFWAQDDTLVPHLELWSEGSVWFDDFSLRQLSFDTEVSVPVRDTLIRVDDTNR